MTLLILGISLVIVVLIVVLSAIHNSDTTGIDITVTRPWAFSIKIRKCRNQSKKR